MIALDANFRDHWYKVLTDDDASALDALLDTHPDVARLEPEQSLYPSIRRGAVEVLDRILARGITDVAHCDPIALARNLPSNNTAVGRVLFRHGLDPSLGEGMLMAYSFLLEHDAFVQQCFDHGGAVHVEAALSRIRELPISERNVAIEQFQHLHRRWQSNQAASAIDHGRAGLTGETVCDESTDSGLGL